MKFVPRPMVTVCELVPGEGISIADCFGRLFKVTLESWVGVNYLGDGWSELLKHNQAEVGDSLLFKFKGPRSCKMIVFGGSEGVQKFPTHPDGGLDFFLRSGSSGNLSGNVYI